MILPTLCSVVSLLKGFQGFGATGFSLTARNRLRRPGGGFLECAGGGIEDREGLKGRVEEYLSYRGGRIAEGVVSEERGGGGGGHDAKPADNFVLDAFSISTGGGKKSKSRKSRAASESVSSSPYYLDYVEMNKLGYSRLAEEIMGLEGGKGAVYDILGVEDPVAEDYKARREEKLRGEGEGSDEPPRKSDSGYKGLRLGGSLEEDLSRAWRSPSDEGGGAVEGGEGWGEGGGSSSRQPRGRSATEQKPMWTAESLDELGKREGMSVSWARKAREERLSAGVVKDGSLFAFGARVPPGRQPWLSMWFLWFALCTGHAGDGWGDLLGDGVGGAVGAVVKVLGFLGGGAWAAAAATQLANRDERKTFRQAIADAVMGGGNDMEETEAKTR